MKPSQPKHIKRLKRNGIYFSPMGRQAIFCAWYYGDNMQYLGVFNQFLTQMEKQIQSEGLQAVQRYKGYKAFFPVFLQERKFPKRGKLRPLQPILRIVEASGFNINVIRACHTVLRTYDLFPATEKVILTKQKEFVDEFIVNTPQILQSGVPTGEDSFFSWASEVSELFQEIRQFNGGNNFLANALKMSLPLRPIDEALFLYKKGTTESPIHPKGDSSFAPSIIGAPDEALRLARFDTDSFRTREKLGHRNAWEFIKCSMDEIGKQSFPSMQGKLAPLINCEPLKPTQPLIMLTSFSDGGYKVRHIRKVAYHLQYVLQPFHDSSFRILKALPNDYTFEQGKGFRALRLLSMTGGPNDGIGCYDATQSTDLYPASFEYYIKRELYPNSNLPDIWWDALTQFPNQFGYEKYGQPMGALDSWASMALCHHVIMWLSLKRAGLFNQFMKNPQLFYAVLGDDGWIRFYRAQHYYLLHMNAVRIRMNMSKSHVTDGGKHTFTEFAKRNSYLGYEVTAISPNLVIKSFTDWGCTSQLARILEDLDPVYYRSEGKERLQSLFQNFATGFTRAAITNLSDIPIQYGGIAPNDASDALAPRELKLIALLRLGTLLKWEIRPTLRNNAGNDVSDQFNDWTSIPIPGYRDSSDLPLHAYNRKMGQKSNVIAERILRQSQAQTVLEFLKDPLNSEETLSFFRELAIADGRLQSVPFFHTWDTDVSFDTSCAYRMNKVYRKLRRNPDSISSLIASEGERVFRLFQSEVSVSEIQQAADVQALWDSFPMDEDMTDEPINGSGHLADEIDDQLDLNTDIKFGQKSKVNRLNVF